MSLPDDVLSDLEKTKLREIFDAIDVDGDGVIEPDDVIRVYKKAGQNLSQDQAEAVVSAADVDGNGQISWDNFCTAAVILGAYLRMAILIKTLFEEMDANSDGFVDARELRTLFDRAGCGAQVTDAQIKSIIGNLDQGNDGKVSVDEFIQALTQSE